MIMADETRTTSFVMHLRQLYMDAGSPTAREMIGETNNNTISAATIFNSLSGRHRPRWASAKRIVELLGGDAEVAHELWKEDRHLTGPRIDTEFRRAAYLQLMEAVAELNTTVAQLTKEVIALRQQSKKR